MELNTSPDHNQQDQDYDLTSIVYENRLLIFLEDKPQSNTYRQLMFTAEEFQRVSLAIGSVIRKQSDGSQLVNLNESNETYKLPDLQSVNIYEKNIKKNIGGVK